MGTTPRKPDSRSRRPRAARPGSGCGPRAGVCVVGPVVAGGADRVTFRGLLVRVVVIDAVVAPVCQSVAIGVIVIVEAGTLVLRVIDTVPVTITRAGVAHAV